ncbi:MAG: cbb3-type cytochrome c oxidase subunit I [Acidobacteriota bacterium]
MMLSRAGSRVVAWCALLALAGCAVTLLSGVAAGVTYTPWEPALRSIGLTLQQVRPIHDTFAFAWVFLGSVTVVYFYVLGESGAPSAAMQRRVFWQLTLWSLAGVGILATLLGGLFSGREYIGYHPAFSVLILIGWLLFAKNYFARVGFRLRGRPVYIYMWTVGICLFVVAYIEGHLYLLDFFAHRPIRDIAIQWKSNGVLVGSFNLLAYGSLMYITGRIQGDDRYSHSRTAYALFCVGLLNSFANYGHHTYHLPQSSWIHWISFSVSMLESIILVKVVLDIPGLWNTHPRSVALQTPLRFVRSAALWSALLLVLALAISVPPLNTLIHGTHVVVAHSMGSMLGIDSMILWAGLAYVMIFLTGPRERIAWGHHIPGAILLANFLLFLLWATLLARGLAAAWSRYMGPSSPDFSLWLAVSPLIVLFSGAGLAMTLFWIFAHWTTALWSAARASTAAELGPLDTRSIPQDPSR